MNSLFRVSERHHSGLILMTELAARYEHANAFRSLSDVAESMSISSGYLEEIALRLREAKLIEGRKGPGGGYRLMRAPKDISIGDIIRAIEGPLAFVDCQSLGCPVEGKCKSKNLWNFLQSNVNQTLNETMLSAVVEKTL